MAWIRITARLEVRAVIEGKPWRLRVREWNPETRAVRVVWPPTRPLGARAPLIPPAELAEGAYHPVHPPRFERLTDGTIAARTLPD